jgi:hypothetical protein
MSGDRNAEQEALHRARKLHRELSEPVDEHFKQSLDGLSRGLGERLAQRSTDDPKSAAEKRRAALAEYDLERKRRVKSILVMAGGGVLSGCIAWAVVMLASPFDDLPMPVAASPKRTVPVEVAAVAAPPPPPAAPPIQVVSAGPVPMPTPARAVAPAVVELRPPLTREEIREMQTKLRGFGFNPGPADGAAGPMTVAAAARYREDRGLGPAEALDRDLLEDLRTDTAPQVVVAQAAPRPYRPPPPRQATRGDGFDGLRTAMQDVERWFQQIGR